MTHAERMAVIKNFLDERVLPTLEKKNLEYSQGADDANANFHRLAAMLNERGIDKYDVLLVYMTKHWDALMYWFRNQMLVSEETVQSRIQDIIAYLLILITLMHPNDEDLAKKLPFSSVEAVDEDCN